MLGYELAVASPELSGEESANLDRFKVTAAYAKLQEFPLRLMEVREALRAILQGGEAVTSACLKPLVYR